ncbi:MAG TPA: hypothetical protein VIY29_11745 [Ktedonobacteraceae bacterium]
MPPTRPVSITDRVLPAVALRSVTPARAVKDACAGVAAGVTSVPFSPTSC